MANGLFGGGTGTVNDPYLIEDKADLLATEPMPYPYYNYKQVADIDLQGAPWTPLGGIIGDYFTGIYDGDGHKITGLYVPDNYSEKGIWSYLFGATIKNLLIEGECVGGCAAGLIAGYVIDGTIDNCQLFGSLNGGGGLKGAIAGDIDWRSSNVKISNCTVDININLESDDYEVGGLAGYVGSNVDIENCNVKVSFTGNISDAYQIGGFIGQCGDTTYGDSDSPLHISKCSSIGNINAGYLLGGFIGEASNVEINDCYAVGNITGTYTLGGFIGAINGNAEIANCYSIGYTLSNVEWPGYVGGFIGKIDLSSTILQVTNCYCAGSVSRPNQVEGPSDLNIGSFIGESEGITNVHSCYYDSDIAEQSDDYAFPVSTTEMKQQATFVDWDFDTIWQIHSSINDGYPSFKWQGGVIIQCRAFQNPLSAITNHLIKFLKIS